MSQRAKFWIGLPIGIAIITAVIWCFGLEGGAYAVLAALFGGAARLAGRTRARANAQAQARVDNENARRDRALRQAEQERASGRSSAAAAERSTTRAPVTRTEVDEATERWKRRKRELPK